MPCGEDLPLPEQPRHLERVDPAHRPPGHPAGPPGREERGPLGGRGRRRDRPGEPGDRRVPAGGRERPDAHAVVRRRALDRVGDRPDAGPLLDVDVDAQRRPRAEHVLEQGHRLGPADPGPAHRRPGQLADPAGAVGRAVERPVVQRDRDAVRGPVRVGLHPPVPQVDGGLERHHRVLQPVGREPAVRERGDTTGLTEVRVRHAATSTTSAAQAAAVSALSRRSPPRPAARARPGGPASPGAARAGARPSPRPPRPPGPARGCGRTGSGCRGTACR